MPGWEPCLPSGHSGPSDHHRRYMPRPDGLSPGPRGDPIIAVVAKKAGVIRHERTSVVEGRIEGTTPRRGSVNSPSYGIHPPIKPMMARVRETPPGGEGWVYEPKWDGFRMIAYSGDPPRLDSRNGKTLLRYFPELRPALDRLAPGTVVDGEILMVVDDVTQFDYLQMRIHPAESRINRLAAEYPARAGGLRSAGRCRREPAGCPLPHPPGAVGASGRHPGGPLAPDAGYRGFRGGQPLVSGVRAGRMRRDHRQTSRRNLPARQAGVDQVEASPRRGLRDRRLPHPQGGRPGRVAAPGVIQHGWQPALHRAYVRTVRPGTDRPGSGAGADPHRGELRRRGHARPGSENRWTGQRSMEWIPVRPALVVQISYDQLQGGRFRHATRLERWRTDKNPQDCTMDQLVRPEGMGFSEIVG